jgi:hypothetical protein
MANEKLDIDQAKQDFIVRYDGLKEMAALLAACPQVIPANIGVEQYLEELKKGARLLTTFLVAGPDQKFNP